MKIKYDKNDLTKYEEIEIKKKKRTNGNPAVKKYSI